MCDRIASFRASKPSRAAMRLLLLLAMMLAGCGEDMSNQPRFEPLERSTFFDNGMATRRPVSGTIARGQLPGDPALERGVDAQGNQVAQLPVPMTAELLREGRTRYDAICANCHGHIGDGQGMIVLRGFPAPPSFHIERLRQAPAGHFFHVISNGYGKMLPFSDQLTVPQRWAVIAYVRALQRSQHSTVDNVPAAAREQLVQGGDQ